MSRHYDVVIVGAGMVGATLALALSRQQTLNIALIEAEFPAPLSREDPYDLRVSALTRSSEFLLQNLGVWSQLMAERVTAFTDMHVWETDHSVLHYDSAEMGEPWLGHLLENRHLQQTCVERCRLQNNIEIISPAKPLAYRPHFLQLDNGLELDADLIVAADGAQSPLREWAGIHLQGWAYRQKGLVCTVTTEKPHHFTAWQRFLPEGPLAFLPLPNSHQCSIVWSLNITSADRLQTMPAIEFMAELNLAFENKLGKVTAISERAAFPLQLRHADSYIKPGLALVGDAAHTIHPLAGQGVNIGLLDAATLAEVVINAAAHGRNIGSLHTLQKYQRQRRADNVLMQMSMDMFKRVFSSQLAPVRWLRKLGLRSVNHSQVLKNLFMQQASARGFAQPELSKRPPHG
ncbi:UbiH/UbiF/VisC/COQ6 family ubiquinone biosynthesis hydroxylase [Methylophaga sp. OBS4]|uniref:UbiH/UbiF/VisC/COQ6 family ubiquinone biosynthesis hydroxylase n=1 Tax=Methylophaga sp. OBS4 TaxID=2991935 RepID=UPI00224F8C37|nr:UbiH/UbiF/VisC/COQ6 family ubiquinone biosynthesis hydroxylase [Methylophaga sp. OBS4]MCX4188237.1 UbiH/UbiF/VisC/COQ6 family ubiquinone biosynthesis hydroxylase [Methylophaga sp. OBS4]